MLIAKLICQKEKHEKDGFNGSLSTNTRHGNNRHCQSGSILMSIASSTYNAPLSLEHTNNQISQRRKQDQTSSLLDNVSKHNSNNRTCITNAEWVIVNMLGTII